MDLQQLMIGGLMDLQNGDPSSNFLSLKSDTFTSPVRDQVLQYMYNHIKPNVPMYKQFTKLIIVPVAILFVTLSLKNIDIIFKLITLFLVIIHIIIAVKALID